MRTTAAIEKRLSEVSKKAKKGAVVRLDYCSRAAACEQILTNMPPDDPHRVELHWSDDEKPADDRQKIRWLRQYPAEKLAEIRSEWEASPGKRARAALAELDRLEPLLAGQEPG